MFLLHMNKCCKQSTSFRETCQSQGPLQVQSLHKILICYGRVVCWCLYLLVIQCRHRRQVRLLTGLEKQNKMPIVWSLEDLFFGHRQIWSFNFPSIKINYLSIAMSSCGLEQFVFKFWTFTDSLLEHFFISACTLRQQRRSWVINTMMKEVW